MGCIESGIRVIGARPRHQLLSRSLGWNGIGFLPSLCGAGRLARMLG